MVTVLTRTIGPSGRDYASFTLAEADVTNIGTSADLVANDEAIVFEADAGTYSEKFDISSTLTTDPTRNVTFRPASGSEHQGVAGQGPHIVYSGNTIRLFDEHVALDGLSVYSPSGNTVAIMAGAYGASIRRCLIDAGAGAYYAAALTDSQTASGTALVIENSVIFSDGTAWAVRLRNKVNAQVRNCTLDGAVGMVIESSTYDGDLEVVNNLSLGPSYNKTGTGVVTLTGSNNFGEAGGLPWPAAVAGSPNPITASTAYDPGAGDFALYVGKNGALLDSPNNDVIDQGVGPSANSDVPTTDILGNARSGSTANPGAFEQPQATTTITKTIGPAGRDYTTFTLAEADVTNIGGSADLVNENERIVFEADAGTYNESVQIGSSLVTDATRNVTYKPAAGSEHGGNTSAGVIIDRTTGRALKVSDDFVALNGLHAKAITASALQLNGCAGAVLSGMIFTAGGSTHAVDTALAPTGSSSAPCVFQNSVFFAAGNRAFYLVVNSGDSYVDMVNCTHVGTSDFIVTYIYSGNTATFALTNCLALGARCVRDFNDASSITGSNNFGGSSFPFPAAIQGSPYPITATTDAEGTPAAGDYAIHDNNGRLYNVTTNDVWQAGIGPASDSDVPTTDILGATRSGTTANPGAFELGVGESNEPPALPGLANATPDFRVHLDRRVTDATTGVSSTYDASTNTTTFTLPYKLNTAATMQVVTRKTSGANAGQSLTVVSTDATNRRVVVSGNHTGTAVFIGEKYTMKYEFSELHLQRNKNTYAAEPITAASHRVRYGRVNYGQTSFFKVTVTPKGGTSSTYVFNGNLLNEPETQLGSVALYDGHFQFPVLADHDRVTIELENDSPLPSRFLSCEWESFYHSRIGSRSRY